MTLAIYPTVRGLTWPIKKVPEFSTLEQMNDAAYRTTVDLYQNPIWHWDLNYRSLRDDPTNLPPGATDTDWRTLLGFYIANKGVFSSFLYQDMGDYQSGPALISAEPNLNCQLQVVEDGGGTFYSPIQRNLGGTNIKGLEDITDLIPTTLAVYDDGSLVTDYTVGGPGLTISGSSFEGLYLVWDSEPTGPVTAQFGFYFRAAFEKDDDLESDWFTSSPNRYEMTSVKLKSVRPNAQQV